MWCLLFSISIKVAEKQQNTVKNSSVSALNLNCSFTVLVFGLSCFYSGIE